MFCSAVLDLKVIGSGQTNFWWLISYTQAKPKMYTESSSEQTSLKQRGQKPAYHDLTFFEKNYLLVRPSFSISFNRELVPVNVTVHCKLYLHVLFYACYSLRNVNNFG